MSAAQAIILTFVSIIIIFDLTIFAISAMFCDGRKLMNVMKATLLFSAYFIFVLLAIYFNLE